MPFIWVSFAIAPYVALLGLLFLVLSVRVTNTRRSARIALGEQNNDELQRRVRAQANFIEYVPLCIILIWLMGQTGAPMLLVHVLSALLVVGRVLHAYSILIHEPRHGRYHARVAGMVCTFTVLGIASVMLLVQWMGLSLR